ncbi:MAG: helix-turn-helix domain-containing protein [Chloroflexi bacterium]|nr:helix-turn-helix domain-containing protein [Chloroflexota bacterium]
MPLVTDRPAVISVEAAARILSISRAQAYALAKEGRLPGGRRIGDRRVVVSLRELERYLEGEREPTG